jgi:hypothetical protein
VARRPRAPRGAPGPDRLHHRRRHDAGAARGLHRRAGGPLGLLRGPPRRDRPLHRGGVCPRRLEEGRPAPPLRGPADPEEAGAALRLGGGHQGPWQS